MIIKLKKRERVIKLTVKLLKRLILLSRLESTAKSKGRKENGCETNHANYLAEKAGTSFPRLPIFTHVYLRGSAAVSWNASARIGQIPL